MMKRIIFFCAVFLACISSGKKPFSFKITEYQDYVKTNVYYYDDEDFLKKQECYNSDNSIQEIIEFFYKENKFDTLILKKNVKNQDFEYRKMTDFTQAYEYISLDKGIIKIKFPEVFSEEIKHMYCILSDADYKGFKTIVKRLGDEKITRMTGFYSPIKYSSYDILGYFVWMDDIIKSYEYSVKDNCLLGEKLLLETFA